MRARDQKPITEADLYVAFIAGALLTALAIAGLLHLSGGV